MLGAVRKSHKDYTEYIFDVRELLSRVGYFAFVQVRRPVTKKSSHEAQQAAKQNNVATWKLLASGMADSQDPHGRLEALYQLQRVVIEQGRGIEEWSGWEGSYALNFGDVCQSQCDSKAIIDGKAGP